MKRINCLVNLIQLCQNVIDVGSDHAYLSIKLLQQKLAKFVVNVDINKFPLKQGIDNLTKHHLLEQTLNLQNDGLKNLELHPQLNITFDYLVISGLGSHAIIDILTHNKLLIKNMLLQSNKNEMLLRKWLYEHKFKIIKEVHVEENHIIYLIIHVVQSKFNFPVSYNTILLGNKKTINNIKLYLDFLLDKQNYIENENINVKIKETKNLKLIKQRIKWCQHQLP